MFCIKIADVVIGIDNLFPCIENHCKGFIVENQSPAFVVSVTWEEILAEANGLTNKYAHCEYLCAYRRIVQRMLAYDAFLMHSAVVSVDGEAYVLAAKSGVGKTTRMLKWLKEFGDRAFVVNGDKPIFRFIGDQLYACGTPWMGKEWIGTNSIVPIKAIYFIERAEKTTLHRLGMAQAMGKIFHQLLIPKDEADMDRFLSLVERMLTTVECWQLKSPPTQEAMRIAFSRVETKEDIPC